MVKASYVPAEYQTIEQVTSGFFSSARAEPVPTVFCSATPAKGWKLTRYDRSTEREEDEADIQDSLEALKEPQGISLEDLKRELGV
jgi:hypothetical protein